MDNDAEPLTRATNEIPLRWYERGPMGAMLPAWAGGLALAYIQDKTGPEVSGTLEHISGAVSVVGGSIVDRLTTVRLIRAQEAASDSGITPLYSETNWLTGQIKDVDDFKRKTRRPIIIGIEIACVALGGIGGWDAAFPLTAIRGVSALNNRRKEKRVQRLIDLT